MLPITMNNINKFSIVYLQTIVSNENNVTLNSVIYFK